MYFDAKRGSFCSLLIQFCFIQSKKLIDGSSVFGQSIMIILLFFRLQDDPPAGVSGAPTENNIMLWNAVIFGYDVDFSLTCWKIVQTHFSLKLFQNKAVAFFGSFKTLKLICFYHVIYAFRVSLNSVIV